MVKEAVISASAPSVLVAAVSVVVSTAQFPGASINLHLLVDLDFTVNSKPPPFLLLNVLLSFCISYCCNRLCDPIALVHHHPVSFHQALPLSSATRSSLRALANFRFQSPQPFSSITPHSSLYSICFV